MGEYKVPHFDSKAESNHFLPDLGVPTTFLRSSFCWDNCIGFGMGPKKGTGGKPTFTLPTIDRVAPVFLHLARPPGHSAAYVSRRDLGSARGCVVPPSHCVMV
jgi:uncharacterized protein YbjT (DUF2867 family)